MTAHNGIIERTQRARITHQCNACKQPIKPGELYHIEFIPPWLDYEGDVDDEGRTVGYLREPEERRGQTWKHHYTCPSLYGYDY